MLLHQTVIGQEAIAQLELAGAGTPDVIVGCVGGGSNFGGLVFPFLRAGADVKIIAAEPAACPTLTRGVYSYDYGDTVGMTPLMPMYTLGHGFVPPPVHAGGLRYHGDAPMVCALVKAGMVEARAYRQNETFEAAVQFARSEGIIPAPEPAHAIRAVIEEASDGEEKTILFGLCGHGHFDLAAYDAFLAGKLEDPEFSEADLDGRAGRPAGGPRHRLGATPKEGLSLFRRAATNLNGARHRLGPLLVRRATSTLVRAARRAGRTAASTPATTATTANASERAGRDGEGEALLAERGGDGGREHEAQADAARRADQRRDDALVAHHPPHLAAGHADRPERAELAASARTSPAPAC